MYNPLTGRDDPYYYGAMNGFNLYGQQKPQQVVQVELGVDPNEVLNLLR